MEALVGQHKPSVDAHALLLEPEPLCARSAADSYQQEVGGERGAVLEGHGDALLVLRDSLEAHAKSVVDAAATERALETLAECLVLIGGKVRKSLDDRDLGAEGGPYARELHADHSAAEHDRARWHHIEVERLIARHHPAADLEARQ